MDDERDVEREVDDMERASERLGRTIDEARSDWRSKQSDTSIPGAVEGPDGEGDEQRSQGQDEQS
jgi:hypothetical protein